MAKEALNKFTHLPYTYLLSLSLSFFFFFFFFFFLFFFLFFPSRQMASHLVQHLTGDMAVYIGKIFVHLVRLLNILTGILQGKPIPTFKESRPGANGTMPQTTNDNSFHNINNPTFQRVWLGQCKDNRSTCNFGIVWGIHTVSHSLLFSPIYSIHSAMKL